MIKKIYISLIFALFSLGAFGQRTSFFETWMSAGVQKKIGELNINLEEGWRVREFYLSRQNYTDLGLMWKINSNFSMGGGYRLSFKNSYVKYEEVSNRFYFDLQAQYKFGDFTISYRPRLQYSSSTDESDYGLFSQTYLRGKLKLEYKISKKISIDAGHELFWYLVPSNSFINENRMSLLGEYKITKDFAVAAGYLLRYYVQVSNPISIHILSVDLTYKF